jgi:hypothetical protein
LRAEKPLQITVRFCDQNGDNGFESRTLSVEPSDWRELAFTFKPPRTDAQARLEIVFSEPATLWVGAVSILPEDHFLQAGAGCSQEHCNIFKFPHRSCCDFARGHGVVGLP